MSPPIMRLADFNANEVCMLAWPDPNDLQTLLQFSDKEQATLADCRVRRTQRPQWDSHPELQAEHRGLFEQCFSSRQTDQLYWADTAHSLKCVVEIRVDGKWVAAAQACTVGPTATVENVMTHDQFRGQGLAKVAVKTLMRWLCQHAKVVVLFCQPEPAQLAIYESVGFRVYKPSAFAPGIRPLSCLA